jgi:hypothetical protein
MLMSRHIMRTTPEGGVVSRAVLIAFCAAICMAGCGTSERDVVQAIQQDFPVIEQMRITDYYSYSPPDGPRCEYFAYVRGRFLTDRSLAACAGYLSLGPTNLDSQARSDLDLFMQESERHEPRLTTVSRVEFSAEGKVASGGFSVGGSMTSYVYAPGEAEAYASSPRSDCAEAINADWYREWDCH